MMAISNTNCIIYCTHIVMQDEQYFIIWGLIRITYKCSDEIEILSGSCVVTTVILKLSKSVQRVDIIFSELKQNDHTIEY